MKTTMVVTSLVTMAVAGFAPEGASALQGTNDSLSVTTAAVKRALLELRPGIATFGVDPRVGAPRTEREVHPQSSPWRAERTAAELEAIRGTGAVISRREDVRTCAGQGPRACSLVGVEAYMSLTVPVIRGDSAMIDVFLEANVVNSPRVTMSALVVRYTLVKEEGKWMVVHRQALGET